MVENPVLLDLGRFRWLLFKAADICLGGGGNSMLHLYDGYSSFLDLFSWLHSIFVEIFRVSKFYDCIFCAREGAKVRFRQKFEMDLYGLRRVANACGRAGSWWILNCFCVGRRFICQLKILNSLCLIWRLACCHCCRELKVHKPYSCSQRVQSSHRRPCVLF